MITIVQYAHKPFTALRVLHTINLRPFPLLVCALVTQKNCLDFLDRRLLGDVVAVLTSATTSVALFEDARNHFHYAGAAGFGAGVDFVDESAHCGDQMWAVSCGMVMIGSILGTVGIVIDSGADHYCRR